MPKVEAQFKETMMKKEQGFSLIELLIVVVIIGVIAALAVPGLQRSKRYAQAGSAIQSLRTITTAENLYERRFKNWATLTDLAPEGTIDPSIASGFKSGYTFTLSLTPDPVNPSNPKAIGFKCNADPTADVSITDHFFVDETAVIRHKEGAAADATSEPIPK